MVKRSQKLIFTQDIFMKEFLKDKVKWCTTMERIMQDNSQKVYVTEKDYIITIDLIITLEHLCKINFSFKVNQFQREILTLEHLIKINSSKEHFSTNFLMWCNKLN